MTQIKFLLTVALTAGISMPAVAAQVVPSLFAPAFCAARRSGMTVSESSRFATRASFNSSGPSMPKVDGISADVKMAVEEAMALCPEAFVSEFSVKRQGLTAASIVL